jgi:hypothetical protein|tara:strand:- start:159 stop:371 length:213 start_codon:yes stop_codon:yes gene_type:complete
MRRSWTDLLQQFTHLLSNGRRTYIVAHSSHLLLWMFGAAQLILAAKPLGIRTVLALYRTSREEKSAALLE